MWLKCNSCGNVYAAGKTESGELRQAGSPCTPLSGKHHLYMASQTCNGTLEGYHGAALQVQCQNCRCTYSPTMTRCPRCLQMYGG
jgi:hypothetical protein